MGKRKENVRPGRTITPESIFAIVLIILFPIMLVLALQPGAPGKFDWYGGPVLPLSGLTGTEVLEVSREVEVDFANYEDLPEWSADPNTVIITDSYALTNPTGEPVAAQLVWGFEGQFVDPVEQFPVITVDGEPADAGLYPAVDPNGIVHRAGNFEAYSKALTENDFLATALAQPPSWDVPVRIYHFSDLAYEGTSEIEAFLKIDYTYGRETNLWVPYFDVFGYDQEEKTYHLMVKVSRGDAWLYVMGDDITIHGISGNLGYNISRDTQVEDVTCKLETAEGDFMALLRQEARLYRYPVIEGESQEAGLMTPELLYDGAMKRIVGSSYQNPEQYVRDMYNIFGTVVTENRMLYWVFPVEIPAGATVTVSARYEQETSENYVRTDPVKNGFDLATTLGSSLNIREQSVTLLNAHLIRIPTEESQNFGFDLESGITTVTLDPSVERYFMDFTPAE